MDKVCKLNIAHHIPLSSIIEKNNNNIEKQIEEIIDKYIKPSSDLMVNISSDVRNKLLCTDTCDTSNHNNVLSLKSISTSQSSNHGTVTQLTLTQEMKINDDEIVSCNNTIANKKLETNIQYSMMQLLEWDQLFDDALNQVYQLLISTFTRFKSGNYNSKNQELFQIAQIIDKEKRKENLKREKNANGKINLIKRVSMSLSEKHQYQKTTKI